MTVVLFICPCSPAHLATTASWGSSGSAACSRACIESSTVRSVIAAALEEGEEGGGGGRKKGGEEGRGKVPIEKREDRTEQ